MWVAPWSIFWFWYCTIIMQDVTIGENWVKGKEDLLVHFFFFLPLLVNLSVFHNERFLNIGAVSSFQQRNHQALMVLQGNSGNFQATDYSLCTDHLIQLLPEHSERGNSHLLLNPWDQYNLILISDKVKMEKVLQIHFTCEYSCKDSKQNISELYWIMNKRNIQWLGCSYHRNKYIYVRLSRDVTVITD